MESPLIDPAELLRQVQESMASRRFGCVCAECREKSPPVCECVMCGYIGKPLMMRCNCSQSIHISYYGCSHGKYVCACCAGDAATALQLLRHVRAILDQAEALAMQACGGDTPRPTHKLSLPAPIPVSQNQFFPQQIITNRIFPLPPGVVDTSTSSPSYLGWMDASTSMTDASTSTLFSYKPLHLPLSSSITT